MEPLFARHTPKHGRVLVMLVGSLLVHGGLVGIGALLIQPQLPEVFVDWTPPAYGETPPIKSLELPEQPLVAEAMPTATPETIEPTASNPPLVVDDPVLAEPSSPTPKQRLAVRTTPSARNSNTPRNSSVVPASPSNVSPGGANSYAPSGTASWVMPHPTYPAAARQLASVSGLTTVRITTDATGHVSSVVIVRSAGNPVLDAHTVSYVRENWRGPANASRTTEFLYQLR